MDPEPPKTASAEHDTPDGKRRGRLVAKSKPSPGKPMEPSTTLASSRHGRRHSRPAHFDDYA